MADTSGLQGGWNCSEEMILQRFPGCEKWSFSPFLRYLQLCLWEITLKGFEERKTTIVKQRVTLEEDFAPRRTLSRSFSQRNLLVATAVKSYKFICSFMKQKNLLLPRGIQKARNCGY